MEELERGGPNTTQLVLGIRLKKGGAWAYRNCSRSSFGDVPVEEMAFAAGYREVAGTVRVHKEAVVKEGDHMAVLLGKPLGRPLEGAVGEPNRSDAGDVVGSRVAMAVAGGGRAEAGVGVAAIGREVVDNPPMGEEVPSEVVLEVGNTWGRTAALEIVEDESNPERTDHKWTLM